MVGLSTLKTSLHMHIRHDAANFIQDLALNLQGNEIWQHHPWVEPHATMEDPVIDVDSPREGAPLGR